jgi:hypothetical protein
MRLRQILTMLLLWAAALPASASFHLWSMSELYSNADGTVQFLEFRSAAGGQQFLSGHTLTSTSGATTNTLNFTNLPGDTAGKRFLVGTVGFAALGVVAPDFVVPNGFFFQGGGSISFAEGVDNWIHPALPAPPMSIDHFGAIALNSPQNFAGQTGSIGGPPAATVVLSGPATSVQGTSVTFTATVKGASPTGTVQFKDGVANLGAAVALAGGVATRSATLSTGSHSILAIYSGDGANGGADSNTLTHTVTATQPPPGGSSAKTLGSRATVSPGVTLFGGFELASASTVYILVRGNSLGTLGVTQNFLDSPRVRLFNSQGQDLLTDAGTAGFTGCSSTANSGAAVVNYYTNVRAQPPHARDGCTSQTLAAGVYTFTVTPSTTGSVSAPSSGEILFEVTLGSGSGSITKTLGSRATVSPSATLFGGFELAAPSTVLVLVRGNSLGTLGVTQSFLDSPRVRLFNGAGQDLINDAGVAGFTGCSSTANAGAAVVTYYTNVRAQPPHARDGCTGQTLAAGVYTFTVTPSTTGSVSAPATGEVLFEVTLSP